jgi:hypothetical protein
MRANDKVKLVREIKVSLNGGVISEGVCGVILSKVTGCGTSMYEVDFGANGVALCTTDDLTLIYE